MQSANGSKSTPVTFRFKNIGPVKEADMELGDLTIIAGRNNTGKTYLAYTLYGFLKTWRKLAASVPDDFDNLVKTVIRTGHVKQSRDRESLNQARKSMIQRLTKNFSEKVLSNVFSSSNATFEDASFKIVLNDEFPLEEQTHKEGNFSITYDGSNIVIEQESFLKNDTSKNDTSFSIFSRTMSIIHKLYMSFLSPNFPHPFILSAERFGISLFYKELDFTKSRLVEALQKLSDDQEGEIDPFFLLDEGSARYALPIKDNIDFTRDLENIQKRKSEFSKENPEIFKRIENMMQAYYKAEGNEIRFISKARKNNRFNIPLHLASSSARGLTDIYFFLKHVAKRGMMVIIDEPESHLHPYCQILMARLIAACINAGIKVFVTTHSDYFVKEINNLIMLSNNFQDKKGFLDRHRKHYSKDDFLKPELVSAYICEKGTLSPCTIDERGIQMESFDDTIDDINKISNELSLRIEGD
jgi:predicted ATPase